jgi:pimeloyl-ACP methyl ester carboxylesterase
MNAERWTVPGGPTIGVRRFDGSGDPLVLIHGLSSSSSHYVGLGHRLAERGWSVSALDLRGHGVSDRVPGTYEITHYAADVEAYLESLPAPAVLVGHSLGAATSVYLAGARPDLVRAVFAEDPPLYHGMPGVMAATPYVPAFRAMRDAMRRLRDAGGGAVETRAVLSAQRTPDGTPVSETITSEAFEARIESFEACDPEVWDPAIEGAALAGWDPHRPVVVPMTVLRADPRLGAALTPDEAARFAGAHPDVEIIEISGAPHGIRECVATAERYQHELDRFLVAWS